MVAVRVRVGLARRLSISDDAIPVEDLIVVRGGRVVVIVIVQRVEVEVGFGELAEIQIGQVSL